MLYQKHVLPLKNWVDWINYRQEKISQPQKGTFWKKSDQKLKGIIFFHMTNFYNFDLKIETSWSKRLLSTFCKLQLSPIMLFSMFGLLILE